jgi:hypothetical protein
MTDNPWRIAGISGILFVVLFIVGGGFSGDVPTYDEGGEEIAAWFAENSEEYLVGDFITGLGFVLFYFLFLGGLYAKLRAAEGDPAIFSRAALIGGILFPVAGLAGGIPLAGLALLEGDVSPDVAELAAATAFHGFTAAGAGSAIIMGAAGILIIRTGAFWTWLGWLAVALALVAIVGSATSIENDPDGVLAILGFIGFIGFGVFVLATSVAMLQTREAARTPAM